MGDAVTVNATALSDPNVAFDYFTSEMTAAAFTLHLLPGSHFVEVAGGLGVANFTVNPDGTLSYAADLQGGLTGQGTSTLGVVGDAIVVNATALSDPNVIFDYYISEKTAAAFTLHLLPGSHFVEGLGVANFTVDPDGRSVTPRTCRGSHRRRDQHAHNRWRRGHHRRHGAIGERAQGVCRQRVGVHRRAVHPSPAAGALDIESTSGTGIVDFTINDDGTVSYVASLASELSGQGTRTLVVKSLS